jgi:hypothetical protein
MFGFMGGTGLPTPVSINAAQWMNGVRFQNFAGIIPTSFPFTVRIEKESSPGSGSWSLFGTGIATNSSWLIDVAVLYVEDASYRIRYERNGVGGGWFAVSTPDPIVPAPSAPSLVTFSNNTFFGSGSITPSEPDCVVEYQFMNDGVPVASGSDVSDGSLSVMGPYSTPASDGTNPDALRARHSRIGLFSGYTSS